VATFSGRRLSLFSGVTPRDAPAAGRAASRKTGPETTRTVTRSFSHGTPRPWASRFHHEENPTSLRTRKASNGFDNELDVAYNPPITPPLTAKGTTMLEMYDTFVLIVGLTGLSLIAGVVLWDAATGGKR